MSKGGSQTTVMSLPAWLQDDVERNLDRADEISQIGYTPYRGATVAALNPMQIAAMQNNRQAARSAGMETGGPMQLPKARVFGGVQGYSAMPVYNDAMDRFQQYAPGQYQAIRNQFINPYTGAAPGSEAALTNDERVEQGIVDPVQAAAIEAQEAYDSEPNGSGKTGSYDPAVKVARYRRMKSGGMW